MLVCCLPQCPDGTIKVFSKGADSAILALLKKDDNVNPQWIIQKTNDHLSEFSKLVRS